MILSILDGSLLIPVRDLFIIYVIFALLYGFMRALTEWKVLVETGKFRLYKDIIYNSKRTKILIVVFLTLVFAILLPLLTLSDCIKLIKEGIIDLKQKEEAINERKK